MKYLLDTNIISNVIDFPRGEVAVRVRREAVAGTVATSIIAVAELRYGYTKVSSQRLREAYERLFESIKIEEWKAPFDHIYADIRDKLEKKGRPIGGMDMLIAAHAMATDAIVVTTDKHFLEVPGLKVENWLR
jgi:tRNA(fMet)-specific endonuclease VapC